MKTSFNGFNEQVASFEAASGVAEGKVVGISANGKVQAVTSGAFCGVCRNVRNDIAAVQLTGYVRVPYTGNLSVGYQKISATTGSKVAADNNGREFLVVDVDSTAKIAGIIL